MDRLRRCKILAMDEVSLFKYNEIESIDYVLRRLTNSEYDAAVPLGGRQFLPAGDPFQLEPVKIDEYGNTHKTFFQSRVWFLTFTGYVNGVVAALDHNHRQSSDIEYFNVLRRVRYGTLNDEDIQSLNSTSATGTIAPRTHTTLSHQQCCCCD